jgi:hypothetical protein
VRYGPGKTTLNRAQPAAVPQGMWQDQRLLAAIAALPAESFLEVPPDGGSLVGRSAARHSHPDSGAEAETGPSTDRIDLRLPRTAD